MTLNKVHEHERHQDLSPLLKRSTWSYLISLPSLAFGHGHPIETCETPHCMSTDPCFLQETERHT